MGFLRGSFLFMEDSKISWLVATVHAEVHYAQHPSKGRGPLAAEYSLECC
jgi:hypothetical protein